MLFTCRLATLHPIFTLLSIFFAGSCQGQQETSLKIDRYLVVIPINFIHGEQSGGESELKLDDGNNGSTERTMLITENQNILTGGEQQRPAPLARSKIRRRDTSDEIEQKARQEAETRKQEEEQKAADAEDQFEDFEDYDEYFDETASEEQPVDESTNFGIVSLHSRLPPLDTTTKRSLSEEGATKRGTNASNLEQPTSSNSSQSNRENDGVDTVEQPLNGLSVRGDDDDDRQIVSVDDLSWLRGGTSRQTATEATCDQVLSTECSRVYDQVLNTGMRISAGDQFPNGDLTAIPKAEESLKILHTHCQIWKKLIGCIPKIPVCSDLLDHSKFQYSQQCEPVKLFSACEDLVVESPPALKCLIDTFDDKFDFCESRTAFVQCALRRVPCGLRDHIVRKNLEKIFARYVKKFQASPQYMWSLAQTVYEANQMEMGGGVFSRQRTKPLSHRDFQLKFAYDKLEKLDFDRKKCRGSRNPIAEDLTIDEKVVFAEQNQSPNLKLIETSLITIDKSAPGDARRRYGDRKSMATRSFSPILATVLLGAFAHCI